MVGIWKNLKNKLVASESLVKVKKTSGVKEILNEDLKMGILVQKFYGNCGKLGYKTGEKRQRKISMNYSLNRRQDNLDFYVFNKGSKKSDCGVNFFVNN